MIRRRRRASQSDEEGEEEVQSEGSYASDGEEDLSEGEEGNIHEEDEEDEDEDAEDEDEDVDSGNGEEVGGEPKVENKEQPKKPDDPAHVPTAGKFFMHDDRTVDDERYARHTHHVLHKRTYVH